MLPWIAQHPWVSLEELSVRFGTTVDDAEADLGLLSFCGLPPYTPDRLITVDIVAGEVRVRFAEYFDRPVRLTTDEAIALTAAAQRLLDVPGSDDDGPLAHAVTKLKSTLGAAFHVSSDIGPSVRAYLAQLRDAIASDHPVDVTYYTAGRDSFSFRRVDPLELVQQGSGWYLHGFCYRADDIRTFRVDRIVGLDILTNRNRTVTTSDPVRHHDGWFEDATDAFEVRLRLRPGAHWLLRAVPTTTVSASEGEIEVVLRAADGIWIEQLVLRLGTTADVVEPMWLRQRVADRARSILDRYDQTRIVEGSH